MSVNLHGTDTRSTCNFSSTLASVDDTFTKESEPKKKRFDLNESVSSEVTKVGKWWAIFPLLCVLPNHCLFLANYFHSCFKRKMDVGNSPRDLLIFLSATGDDRILILS